MAKLIFPHYYTAHQLQAYPWLTDQAADTEFATGMIYHEGAIDITIDNSTIQLYLIPSTKGWF